MMSATDAAHTMPTPAEKGTKTLLGEGPALRVVSRTTCRPVVTHDAPTRRGLKPVQNQVEQGEALPPRHQSAMSHTMPRREGD